MKKIAALAVLWVLLAGMLSCSSKSADAASLPFYKIGGCKYSRGAFPVLQQWYPGANTRVWGEPAQITYGHFLSYGNAYYWKCVDFSGHHDTKIKFYAYKFCVSRSQGSSPGGGPFGHEIRGFWYDPYFVNAGNNAHINPGQVKIAWNGSGPRGEEHCTKKISIAKSARFWMTVPTRGNSPHWEVGGHIDQRAMPDPHFNFDFTGNRHYVPWPGDDRMLKP